MFFLQAYMHSIYNFQQNSPPSNTSHKFPLWNVFYVLFCLVFFRFTFVLSSQTIPSTLHTELHRHLLLHKLRLKKKIKKKLHSPLKWSQKIVRIFPWKSLFFNFLSLCSVLTHWISISVAKLVISDHLRWTWFKCDVPYYILSVE